MNPLPQWFAPNGSGAELMLQHTQEPIKVIAERTGFSSVHYFTRLFTKFKGIPCRLSSEMGLRGGSTRMISPSIHEVACISNLDIRHIA